MWYFQNGIECIWQRNKKNCKFKLNFGIFFCVLPWIEIYIQIFYKHMSARGCVCGMHIYNLRLFGQQRHSTTANNVRNATNQTLPPPLPTHTPFATTNYSHVHRSWCFWARGCTEEGRAWRERKNIIQLSAL